MIDPVSDFIEVLRELPVGGQQDVVVRCWTGIGSHSDVRADPAEQHPLRQLIEQATLDDMSDRLRFLVQRVGLSEEFLICGLLTYLIDSYHVSNIDDATADAIDEHLGTIQTLENDLDLPIDQRTHRRPDDELRGYLEDAKSMAANARERMEYAAKMCAFFDNLRQEKFNRDYWRNFNRENL